MKNPNYPNNRDIYQDVRISKEQYRRIIQEIVLANEDQENSFFAGGFIKYHPNAARSRQNQAAFQKYQHNATLNLYIKFAVAKSATAHNFDINFGRGLLTNRYRNLQPTNYKSNKLQFLLPPSPQAPF